MYDQAAVDVQLQTLTTVSPPSPCPFITGQIKIELPNLTLLLPSPYRLITGQTEVDLINLEDEFDTINSQLPKNLVAASLYFTLIVCNSRSLTIFSQSGQLAGVFHSHPTLVQSKGVGVIIAGN